MFHSFSRFFFVLSLTLGSVSAFATTSETATFAGGCFWCMQAPFDSAPGVLSTTVGYTGGTVANPTYEQVSAGSTGHAESVEVQFDPTVISYEKILDIFWHQIDPTTLNRQFVDVGNQYRTAIFYHNEKQKLAAEKSKADWEKKGVFHKPIVTEITKAGPFYKAEDYHQQYYKKSPTKYKYYRYGSGRDKYLESIWGTSGH